MIGVRVPAGPPPGLSRALAERDIYVSVRSDSIRIAPHVYNDGADIDRLFDTLAALV